ncbi:CYFA0S25e00650g1_1 [Cyberlindnera fabianii]|uniref:CYFA0S25e00650g1_1 n=1 Tax=Cyberlindnera fabianii TaxID=36022 RepID=A0A061BI52_CYBFA|nr:CYFA0S25e00650g1_1 [Cyberlindnera fabianii]
MPPKKNQKNQKPKAKADVKKKVEDKTFGMKNKNKSTKVQKLVREIESTTMSSAQAKKELAMAKRRAEEKKAAEQAKKEAALLLAQRAEQKVPFGVDPKSVLCINFRDGHCTRGAKCKFSHDLNIGKRATKKDLYTDDRKQKEADTMDNWDESKLRDVIKSKHGNARTTTDKVCKFFIEAVEDGKYGWFWVCPNNGDQCMYKHSLPEGFVLKTKEQKRLEKMDADARPKISLEEFIETERDKLPKTNLTPITMESFAKWKQQNEIKRLNDEKKNKEKAKRTGRQIFEEKYLNKVYVEEGGDDTEIAFDMSQFRKALEEGDENIKDYGDGKNVTFDIPQEKKHNDETKSETSVMAETTAEPAEATPTQTEEKTAESVEASA